MDIIVNELLIGESEVMRQLRSTIVRIAPASIPVLIEGPTGSGKELVARALHAASGRQGQFVAFNVCAIADTMFEDALFGHVRGAFTGAMSDAPGYLRQAHDGTAFLDEVSGLPLGSQAKLLRAVETGDFRPVGAGKDARSNFRLVTATNQHLESLVGRGAFREDLMHRFGKLTLRLPALRDRKEDVPMLADHFVRLADPSRSHVLDQSGLDAAYEYDWPGNVRELRSAIETVVALAVRDRIGADDLRRVLKEGRPRRVPPVVDAELRRTLDALIEVHGDADKAAERLGVHRSTIYRRVQRAQSEGLRPT
jgi:DNA-binding NtrC family response regulator